MKNMAQDTKMPEILRIKFFQGRTAKDKGTAFIPVRIVPWQRTWKLSEDANAHEVLGMVLLLLAWGSDPATCLAVTEQGWHKQS